MKAELGVGSPAGELGAGTPGAHQAGASEHAGPAEGQAS
jgi:hypothetical protein